MSIRACSFVATFARFLGPQLFDLFSESSLHHLLKLAGTTKKIIAAAATEAARTVAQLMMPQRAVPVVVSFGLDKNGQCRLRAFETLKLLLERACANDEPLVVTRLWEGVAEKILARGIGDANAEIRACAVAVFRCFQDKLPELSGT